jgi:hypothetical protein
MNDILTVPVRSVATDKKDVLRFSHLGQRKILGVNSIDSHFLLLRLKSRDKFNNVNCLLAGPIYHTWGLLTLVLKLNHLHYFKLTARCPF